MRNLERYAAEYKSLPFEEVMISCRRRKILEHVALYRPAALLEVGCGTSPLFLDLEEVARVAVVEPTEAFWKSAVSLIGGRPNVTVHRGTIEELATGLKGTPFDFIVAASVLHEVDDPIRFLAALRSLCGPGTVVHINVPNAHSFHRLLAVRMGLQESVYSPSDTQRNMQQPRIYDIDSLQALVLNSGFRPLHTGTLFIKPFTHRQMATLSDSAFLTPLMLEGLTNMIVDLPDNGAEIYMLLTLSETA